MNQAAKSRALALASIALLVATPSHADLSPGQQAALEPWRDCLIANARDLDDHQSDASTIAPAVRAACGSRFLVLKTELLRKVSTVEAQRVLSTQYDQMEADAAISAVLHSRKTTTPAVRP